MTKIELAKQLTRDTRFRWMSVKTAQDIIETALDLMICHLQDGGEEITIRGFGTLKTRRRRAFVGKDPRTGEQIQIPERLSVVLKPSAEMLRRINSQGV